MTRAYRPSRDHVLMAIQHVSLRRIRDFADARVPQGLSGGRVVRHQASRAVAGEDQSARGRQQSAAAAVRRNSGCLHATLPVL